MGAGPSRPDSDAGDGVSPAAPSRPAPRDPAPHHTVPSSCPTGSRASRAEIRNILHVPVALSSGFHMFRPIRRRGVRDVIERHVQRVATRISEWKHERKEKGEKKKKSRRLMSVVSVRCVQNKEGSKRQVAGTRGASDEETDG